MTILCVTPNPGIDRTLSVPGFTAGGVWRAREVHAAAGGKGLNVARALLQLGSTVRCTGLLGGDTGRRVASLAEAAGLPARWTWIGGETRTSVIVVGDRGETTVINEPGPVVSEQEWERFVLDVAVAADDAAAVCISGRLPPAPPSDGLVRLIRAAADRGRPVWVDTSGPALTEAIAATPAGIKINAEEAAALLGRTVRTASEALAAARYIRRRGTSMVGITLGDEGAVLAGASGDWQAVAPKIDPLNPVGSGDCFLAGLAAALADGENEAAALRRAVACGAANAMTAHAGEFDKTTVAALADATLVREAVRDHRA